MDTQNMNITRIENAKTTEISQSKKKPELIQMKKSNEKTVLVSFMLEQSVAEECREFNKNVPYKKVTLGHALRRFMNDVRLGKIKFELEL